MLGLISKPLKKPTRLVEAVKVTFTASTNLEKVQVSDTGI